MAGRADAQFGYINTIAGNGTAGFAGDGGLATAAELKNPSDVFKDGAGNIYIADNGNNRIRKINTAGIISTIAGTGTAGYTGDGGLATAATLNAPNRVFVDGSGNVYIADQNNNVIRMINTAGIISTIVGTGTAGYTGDGGLATSATLSSPTGVAVDATGNIFISDLGNNVIRKVNTSGIISTYAGGGATGFTTDGVAATSISLCAQQYVSVDASGTIYITNHDCWHFLKITAAGLIYNVAGAEAASYSGDCGPADSAEVDLPYGITPDNLGNIYLCPRGNKRIRRVNSLDYIQTVAGDGVSGYSGDGGPATSAEISSTIYGIYADVSGNVYFADMGNNRIRLFTASEYADTMNLCVGASDTLHDSTSSGTWTSGNTSVATIDSVTGAVTGIAAGTATITYDNIACPALYLVNVLSPTVSLGPDTIVCGGSSLTLSSSVVYSVTPVTYAWSTGATSPTIPVSASGTYWLSVTEAGCTAPADTINVTFNPVPPVNLGDDTTFCSGNSYRLQSSDVYTATPVYLWSSGSAANSINVSATGTYWLDVTINGCTGSDTVNITVNPLPPVPVLGSNSPACVGASVDLTATDTTGAGYSWAGPAGFTSTLQNPVRSPALTSYAGIYSVIATLAGCTSGMATEYVAVDASPGAPTAGSNAPVCSGSTLFLTATDPTAGVTYNWSGPGGFTSTLQNPAIASVPATGNGTYTVTASLGTCAGDTTLVVNIIPTPPAPLLTENGPLCSGSDTTLILTAALAGTYTDAATYNWTGPQGFTSTLQTAFINPVDTEATGIYSAIATFEGCISPMSTEGVLVDSTPVPPTVVSPPVCWGTTLNISVSTPTSGVSYFWTGPGGFTSTMQNLSFPDATTADSGNYIVVLSRGSCYDTAFVEGIVNPVPVIYGDSSNSPANRAICSGISGELSLFAAAVPYNFTTTYSWTGPNGFTSTAENPAIFGPSTLASGYYTVTATLNGCISADSIVYVRIDSTPAVPVLSSNSPVCQGATLQFTVTGSTSGVTYSWTGPDSFTSTVENPSISNVQTVADGTYSLNVALGSPTYGYCYDSASTFVVITPISTFSPSSNSPVCTGDTLKLFANDSGATFTWAGPYDYFPAAALSASPTILNATTENAGVYTVTAFFSGCYLSETDTVIVNVTPPPPSVSWLTYCQYYPASPLMADASGITWYGADTVSADSTHIPPTPSTQSVGSTFFYLNQTANGCTSGIDSIKVTVNPKPAVSVDPADTGVCPGSVYTMTAFDTDAVTYYHWYPSIYLSDSTTASATVRPETSEIYTVIVTNAYGCTDTATASVVVYPAAVISVGDSVTLYPGQTYTMTTATNCTAVNWFPAAGLSNANIPDPVVTPILSTKYTIYGATSDGCTTSDSISVYVSANSQFALPNAFTPGNGVNNVFKIILNGEATLSYFRIFNRWGEKVFETTNINDGWDGTFNGAAQPFGVYVYELEAVSVTGQTFTRQGNVTLIR